MYKIIFYVPENNVEEVKSALFEAGAGKVGDYTHCSWQVKGEGQFMPKIGSHAFVGEVNQLEKITEYKVEMVCNKSCIQKAINALLKAHPYETPAYQVLSCEDF